MRSEVPIEIFDKLNELKTTLESKLDNKMKIKTTKWQSKSYNDQYFSKLIRDKKTLGKPPMPEASERKRRLRSERC